MSYAPRKQGRPYRSPEGPSGVSQSITIRLNAAEMEAVAAHVEKTGETRADLIRLAMDRLGLFSSKRIAGLTKT